MSTASKITLAASTVFTAITVVWVHKVQEEERQVSP
jgi:protein PET117